METVTVKLVLERNGIFYRNDGVDFYYGSKPVHISEKTPSNQLKIQIIFLEMCGEEYRWLDDQKIKYYVSVIKGNCVESPNSDNADWYFGKTARYFSISDLDFVLKFSNKDDAVMFKLLFGDRIV